MLLLSKLQTVYVFHHIFPLMFFSIPGSNPGQHTEFNLLNFKTNYFPSHFQLSRDSYEEFGILIFKINNSLAKTTQVVKMLLVL